MAENPDTLQSDGRLRESGKHLPGAADSAMPHSFSGPPPGPMEKLVYGLDHIWLFVTERIAALFIRERELGAAFNCVPLLIAAGCVIYFQAPVEPSPFIPLALIPLLLYLVRAQWHGHGYYLLLCAALLIFGMAIAGLATKHSQAPKINRQITTMVEGTVLLRDANRRAMPRYIIKVHTIDGLSFKELPSRLRVSSSSRKIVLDPGDRFRGLARLQPVSGPVYPGGYDFAFFAHFQKLGGSGFLMGAPEKLDAGFKLSRVERALVALNRTRLRIADRIQHALTGTTGDIAIALVIGDKTRIPEKIQETLRVTGLAHILAISGLHMALVTLTVIFLCRFMFSLSPRLSQRLNVRKISVLVAFFFATTYLLLSGFGVATQRAWIMTTVMLLAVLLDRRAITMRSVAISAVIILALSPQSLYSPGFQMSFSAVSALVACYEAYRKYRAQYFQRNPDFHNIPKPSMMRVSLRYLVGIFTTSLIAGSATAFVAAWHFHQVPVLGLPANMAAMPIVSLVIMPFVLLSLLFMPFGYEALPLMPVHYGIEWMIAIAAGIEGRAAPLFTGQMSGPAGLFFLFAFVPLVVLRTRLRFIGLLAAVPVLAFVHALPVPDIVIAENGRAVAVKTDTEHMAILFPRRDNFVTRVWARTFGMKTLPRLEKHADACNRDRCIHVLPQSLVLHIVYDPDLLKSSCRRADVLIAPRLWWVNCTRRKPALIIKRGSFEARGSHAIHVEDRSKQSANKPADFRVISAYGSNKRPWHRNAPPVPQ